MHGENIYLHLRKNAGLSQDEMADKLYVTRQAVSRWENGETLPSTDTLKRMSKAFDMPIDALLGNEAPICQSCGMTLDEEANKGSERDGDRSNTYCIHCYQDGAFTQDRTMEEQVESNLRFLDEWNKEQGTSFSKEEARIQLMELMPTLGRWKAQ
ncbi:helix-turn-helix domain-containing protein [Eubacteriales bacterium OttesenSCG-928-M02]|nr:helix-turn-helix domain-containing protein [Eubacteriales bacterium OttesenSCG-928-M02]